MSTRLQIILAVVLLAVTFAAPLLGLHVFMKRALAFHEASQARPEKTIYVREVAHANRAATIGFAVGAGSLGGFIYSVVSLVRRRKASKTSGLAQQRAEVDDLRETPGSG